jgi:hypothetical protein
VRDIKLCIENHGSHFGELFTHATDVDLLAAYCVAVRLLIRWFHQELPAIFATPDPPLFLWLGQLAIRAETYQFFAQIASAITLAANPVKQVFVSLYFRQCSPARPSPALARVSDLVSHLLLSQRSHDQKIDRNHVNAALLGTHQLVELDRPRVIRLVSALGQFYLGQVAARGKGYRDSFPGFRVSVLQLFAIIRDSATIVMLLDAVECLLEPHGNDPTDFMERFIGQLLGLMSGHDGDVVATAWRIFRKWLLRDPAVDKCIIENQVLKGALVELAKSVAQHRQARAELVLIFKAEESKGILKRKSAVVAMLLPLFKAETEGA